MESKEGNIEKIVVVPKESGAFTIEEFLRFARIGRTKAYAEIRENRLRAVKMGRKTLILRRDAEAWLESLPEAA